MGPSPAQVSMLGKLFSIGSGASANDQEPHMAYPTRPVAGLDSVQEDIHTRSLLFPDAHSLYLHRNDQVFPLSTTPSLPVASMTNAFDYTGELDLEARDVRVLIMQDALGSSNASLLFDSHPSPIAPVPPSTAVTDPRRTPTSPRKSSIGQTSRPLIIQPDNPHLRQGAFDRRGDYLSRTHSFAETDGQRANREYREELATFTSCIFGSSELMAYKGTSTKVHVVPTESRYADHYSASSVIDGRGSIGRASMRSSRLAQSYSSEIMSPTHASASFATSQLAYRPPERKKILITRLFPVVFPSDEDDTAPKDEGEQAAGGTSPRKKPVQPRPKRTPMYAVVLVVQLPTASAAKSLFRGASSFTDQESFPSSYNSTRRSGWTMVGSGNDSMDSSLPFDGEDPMDSITQHWDIIMRTLTHLQSVTATTLGTLLKQADRGPSATVPTGSHPVTRRPSLPSKRPEDLTKPPKTNAKIIALPPNALSQDQVIQHHTQVSRIRIVTGLKAARVVTGQGRWGIWRDEARLASRSSDSLDQHFLLTSLTGFLANHADWLQALSPAWCRKKYLQQQRSGGEEDLAVTSRTIIVSEDKMAARRFVFLLSAFLPAHQSVPTIHPHRPSTSTSFGPLSQSPPSVIVPLVREESLRRKMTRRTGPRRASHSRTVSQSTRASIPTQLAHLSMDGPSRHERRGSDAVSIRTTNLSMHYGEPGSRKSVAAATTTISPDSTVPHFSTVHRADSRRSARPGSSSSVAAEDLRRSLQRGDSIGQASTMSNESRNQGSRWGSVISGLWSGTRRRDSTNTPGDGFQPPLSPGYLPSPTKPTQAGIDRSSRTKSVAEMAQELSLPDPSLGDGQMPRGNEPETPRVPQQDRSDGSEALAQGRRWPEPGASFESRVKTTVNREDGIVDVDVPFPDFLMNPHSFDTAVSSPSSSGYLSTPVLGNATDTFEQACRLALEGDMPLNSAGWLQAYHPDFVLQAIPPQRDLLKEVKASLQAEPSPPVLPSSKDDTSHRWVDISSAVIADMTTGKVFRIRYRRLMKPRQWIDKTAGSRSGTGGGVYGGVLLTPSILPYEATLKEEFIQDEISNVDERLADAVERVIAHIGDNGKALSSNSSRSNSKARRGDGRRRLSTSSPPPEEAVGDDAPQTALATPEVPRNECRTVILSALADLIQDVVARRGEDANASPSGEQSAIRLAIRDWLDSLDLASE